MVYTETSFLVVSSTSLELKYWERAMIVSKLCVVTIICNDCSARGNFMVSYYLSLFNCLPDAIDDVTNIIIRYVWTCGETEEPSARKTKSLRYERRNHYVTKDENYFLMVDNKAES